MKVRFLEPNSRRGDLAPLSIEFGEKMNRTTFTSTATTATSIVTSTTTVSSTGTGPTLGQFAGRRRTLAYGFEEPPTSGLERCGPLDAIFVQVLGIGSHFQHQPMIDKICIDIGRVDFVSPTEPALFEQVASNMKSRLHEVDRIKDLEALIEAIEHARVSESYKEERVDLLGLLTILLKMSKLLEMNEKIAVLRKELSAVVGRLDISLWPKDHTEPALSARSSKVKKSEKRHKNKKADKGNRKKKEDSNSSDGNVLRRTAKRLSMNFTGADSDTSKGAQEKITPQQLLEQEKDTTHGKDWAESSDWWREHGWAAAEVTPASEHESVDA